MGVLDFLAEETPTITRFSSSVCGRFRTDLESEKVRKSEKIEVPKGSKMDVAGIMNLAK